MILIITLLISFFPLFFWITFVQYHDRHEPEPNKLIRRALYLGFISVIFALIIAIPIELLLSQLTGQSIVVPNRGQTLTPLFILVMFFAGPIEETIKLFLLKKGLYFSKDFNQIFDGIVYGIIIATVFAFLENLIYLKLIFEMSDTNSQILVTYIIRNIFSVMLHITATGFAGYYLAKAKFSKDNKKKLIFKGLVIASMLHGVYNITLAYSIPFVSFAIVLVAFMLLFRLFYKSDVKMFWKYVPPKVN